MKINVVDEFHKLWYGEKERSPILNKCRWMGVPIVKNPLDLFIYQEIMWECRPDIIIETGTFKGGSALWFSQMAELMDLFGVISIDKNLQYNLPSHTRLKYLAGSSVDETVVSYVKDYLDGAKGRLKRAPRVMVALDSDHSMEHVLKELDVYSTFVTEGQYLIVEDSNVNGHPVLEGYGPGPMEALLEWLPKHPEYEADRSRERFLLTMSPNGFLRKNTNVQESN